MRAEHGPRQARGTSRQSIVSALDGLDPPLATGVGEEEPGESWVPADSAALEINSSSGSDADPNLARDLERLSDSPSATPSAAPAAAPVAPAARSNATEVENSEAGSAGAATRHRHSAPANRSGTAAVNCEWGPWGPWARCSASCGWGKTHAVRRVTVREEHGGRPCVGNSTRELACKYINCPVQCEWGRWSDWTSCGRSCGGGIRERMRAKAVVSLYGGKDCIGNDTVHEPCNTQPCPVNCLWADWGDWSECSRTCGGGLSYRDRGIARKEKYGGLKCEGHSMISGPCKTQGCPVNCKWADWSPWGACSLSCGNGTKTRNRVRAVLAQNNGSDCVEPEKQHTACNQLSCPVDCKWSSWTAFTPCSKSCGSGEWTRTREVITKRAHYGKECEGKATMTEVCNNQSCPVNCEWLPWGNWSQCTKSCGVGMQSRVREMLPAKFDGLPCNGSAEMERPCNEDGCPIDCKWSDWGPWDNCTATCGGGVKTRKRTIAVAKAWKGQDCTGKDVEEEPCHTEGCAVDCEWSDWEMWSTCTRTCGGGRSTRTRFQVTRKANDGKECPGNAEDDVPCNEFLCPVNCRWGDWTAWTACTATCSNGTKSRTRTMEVEEANGGVQCDGKPNATESCNTEPCPVDCEWGEWSDWPSCSQTCGGGIKNRTRVKLREAAFNGRECLGLPSAEQPCQEEPCPVDCHWEEWGPWSSCSVTCGVGVKRRARPKLEEQFGGHKCTENGTEEVSCHDEASAMSCPPTPEVAATPPTEAPSPAPTVQPTPFPTPSPPTEPPTPAPTPPVHNESVSEEETAEEEREEHKAHEESEARPEARAVHHKAPDPEEEESSRPPGAPRTPEPTPAPAPTPPPTPAPTPPPTPAPPPAEEVSPGSIEREEEKTTEEEEENLPHVKTSESHHPKPVHHAAHQPAHHRAPPAVASSASSAPAESGGSGAADTQGPTPAPMPAPTPAPSPAPSLHPTESPDKEEAKKKDDLALQPHRNGVINKSGLALAKMIAMASALAVLW